MAIKYATPAGAGDKDGTTPANAFGAAELFTFLHTGGGFSAGDKAYVLTGTYALTRAVSVIAGSATAQSLIIGVRDLTTLLPASGDDRPLFVCGANEFTINSYTRISNIQGTCSNVNGLYLNGTNSESYNCYFNNTNAGGTRYGICISGTSSKAINSRGETLSATGTGIYCIGSYARAINCVSISSAYRAFVINTANLIEKCIAGNATFGVTLAQQSNAVDLTIYNCTTGLTINQGVLVRNVIIKDCDVGVKINASYSKEYQNFDFINIHNCGIKYSSDGTTEDLTLAGENDTYLDPQFIDAENGNFGIGANLRNKGFPSTFPNIPTISYTDIGAVQIREVLPAITDVKKDVKFGANGTELTGTLAGGGGRVKYSFSS